MLCTRVGAVQAPFQPGELGIRTAVSSPLCSRQCCKKMKFIAWSRRDPVRPSVTYHCLSVRLRNPSSRLPPCLSQNGRNNRSLCHAQPFSLVSKLHLKQSFSGGGRGGDRHCVWVGSDDFQGKGFHTGDGITKPQGAGLLGGVSPCLAPWLDNAFSTTP